MTDGGWHPIWRKLYDPGHWLAPSHDDLASRRDAWVDLCLMASHRPRRVEGTDIELGRGELLTSVRTLADRWTWPKTRVERFLAELLKREMLGTVNGTRFGTVYRIVEYETYALPWDTDWDSKRDKNKKDKNNPPVVPPSEPDEPPATKQKRRHQIPPDWQPHEGHARRCQEKALDMAHEAEKFRAWHEGRGSLMISWDRAFDTWLLKAVEFARANGKPAKPQESIPFGTGAARIVP